MKDQLEPGEVFAERVREIRKARSWTQGELARRLIQLQGEPETDAAVHTWRMVVTRTESRKRKATIEDLFLFAAALGVAPGALVDPGGAAVYLTVGQLELAPIVASAWAAGVLPLTQGDTETWERFTHTVGAEADLMESLDELDASPQPITDTTREALLAFVEARRAFAARFLNLPPLPWPTETKESMRAAVKESQAMNDKWEAVIGRLPREEDEPKPQQRKEGA